MVDFVSFPTGMPPFSYSWQFSNGDTSSLSNPTINFQNNTGVTWSTLTVTDANGCVSSHSTSFQLPIFNSACFTNFSQSANYQFGNAGEVFFNSQNNGLVAGTYLWDFGDGTTSTQMNPVHVYTSSGFYNVCLTYTANFFCQSYWCSSVYVDLAWWNSSPFQGPCTAGFLIIPGSSNAGFINVVNTSQGNSLFYSWDFGNGFITNLPYPFISYNNPGNYNICLTITDTMNGCTDTFCDSLSIDSLGNVYRTGMSGNVGLLVSSAPLPNSLISTSVAMESENTGISISPNPSNGNFEIKFYSGTTHSILEVFDVTGNLVENRIIQPKIGINQQRINLVDVDNGIYFIKISNSKEVMSARIVLQK
jgi:PKD repeat protein